MEVLEIKKSKTEPFEIAKYVNKEGKTRYFICMGWTKMSKEFKSVKEAEKYIEEKPYELIFAIAEAVFNFKSKQNGNN